MHLQRGLPLYIKQVERGTDAQWAASQGLGSKKKLQYNLSAMLKLFP